MALKFPQRLVLGTTALSVLLAVVVSIFHWSYTPKPLSFKTEGLPFLGANSAPVEMVLFEDFYCKHCKIFNESILPEINKEFIEKGMAKFLIFPVQVIEGSKALANAAIAVQKIAPDRYFHYIQELFQYPEDKALSNGELLEVAEEVGGIDLVKLQVCIETQNCLDEVEKNLSLIRDTMGHRVGLPALYVNGVLVPTTSIEYIRPYVMRGVPR